MNKKSYVLLIMLLIIIVASCGAYLIFDNESSVKTDKDHYETSSVYNEDNVNDETPQNNDSNVDSLDDSSALDDTEQIYDCMPIVNAYKTGDSSSLDEKQKQVLSKAQWVLTDIISDNMTDYERELAVHDYIILNSHYDDDNVSALGEVDSDSKTPYGILINEKAVCIGYSSTFMMFMKMLDIQCEYIVNYDGDEIHHSFNRVCLDNSWYYVDVTWDDPISYEENGNPTQMLNHQYFNLTYDRFYQTHDMSEDCPSSDSEQYCYSTQNAYVVSNNDELVDALTDAVSKNNSDLCIRFSKDYDIGLDYSSLNTKESEIYVDFGDGYNNLDNIIQAFYTENPNSTVLSYITYYNGDKGMYIEII